MIRSKQRQYLLNFMMSVFNLLVDTKPPLISTRITHIQPLVAFLQPENKNQEDTLLISDELYNNFVFLEISLASQTSDTNQV